MNAVDWLCILALLVGLVIIGLVALRQAYYRAHPKPRAPLTRWQDGRHG